MEGEAANTWYIIKQGSGWNFIPLGSWGQCRISVSYPIQVGTSKEVGVFLQQLLSVVGWGLVPGNVKIPAHPTFPQPLSKMQYRQPEHIRWWAKAKWAGCWQHLPQRGWLGNLLKVKINEIGCVWEIPSYYRWFSVRSKNSSRSF